MLGIVYSINAFLPLLRLGRTKKIVAISTTGGDPEFVLNTHLSAMAAYGTTRAGSNMVIAKYAKLLEGEGFVVVGVSPGIVDTSATSATPGDEMNSR